MRDLRGCGLVEQAMTNDEARMTKEAQSPNDEPVHLDIRHSSFFRHSSLVIRHSFADLFHILRLSPQSASEYSSLLTIP
jgi:hypothetical protein